MARQTRQQRRQRRQQRDGTAPAEPKLTQRARARQQQVRPASQPAKQQTGRRESAPRGRFVRESWGELRKVEWPRRNQVVTGTVVVIIACAIVGAYLWVADLAFKNIVERVLL
ncbi:MAG: preprotein translocase subunit SecE [Gaiellaceae bacterium]